MKYSVSIIIPAYNEEKNIMYVLNAVTKVPDIEEIICIDDGSTDHTNQIINSVKKIQVLTLKENHGKAYAIATGIRAAKGEIVILLDADLHGITDVTIHSLLGPLFAGTHDVVVGYPSKKIDKLFKPISGQRAYFKKDLLPLLTTLEQKGYGLELYLNFAFRLQRVKSISLSGVSHIVKHRKHPVRKALKWYFSEVKEMLVEIFLQDNPISYFANTYIFPFYWQRQITRILFVFDSLSPIGGGSQVAALTWIKNLQEQGIVVKILCNNNASDFIDDLSKDTTIGLPYINLHKLFPHYYPTLFLTRRIKEEIRRFAPDIIHLHEPTYFASRIASFAKKEGIATIFSFQTDFSKQTTTRLPFSFLIGKRGIGNKFLSWWQYQLCIKVDLVLVPTEYYQKLVSKKIKKKVFLLTLPIKKYFYSVANPEKKGITKLLVVSRLIENKHIDVLIRMMFYLDTSFHLTIIGDGPDKTYLHNLIKELHLEERITCIDWVKLQELPQMFVASDVYLSASDSETFGLTYISALATKTPCILYDYPISKEIIPADTALFMKTFDPKEWAQTVLRLRNDPQIYHMLKQNIEKNYDVFKKYDERESTKQLTEVYKHIIHQTKKE